MKKKTFLMLLLAAFTLNAETKISFNGAWYLPDHKGYQTGGTWIPVDFSPVEKSTDLQRDLGSSWGPAEALVKIDHSYTFPMLQGESFLTRDNNLKVTLTGELSPVTLQGGAEAELTPVAFMKVALGSALGTGWNMGFNGLGLNNDPDSEPEKDSFPGVVSFTWLETTLQFDLAAVLPGTEKDKQWKHVLMLFSSKMSYKHFSGAAKDQPWQYQADSGSNYNGFILENNFFLGYQMPLILERTGILVNTKEKLFSVRELSPTAKGGWGSDFRDVRFGPVFNFKMGRHEVALLPQFAKRIRLTDETVRNIHFTQREADRDNPWYLDFDRIVILYSCKL